MTDLIAFIADRLSPARIDIVNAYELVSTQGDRRGIVRVDGRDCPFVIITYPDQLRGLDISEYHFLPSSVYMKSSARIEMEMIAKSRMRHTESQP